MKILKLRAENVKRLSAIEITPDGHTVTIGGKNEAGKSSVLDAIAMALGGGKLAPKEPIRQGQNDATIEVDLGDYVVTRRFKRVFKEAGSDQPDVPTSDYTSALVVTSKPKGDEPAARFASPQAMLDKLLGALTFDPLTFATGDARTQAETLRRVVKLDTSDLDGAIRDLEAKRTDANRELKTATAQLAGTTRYEDAPAARIRAADVAGELEVAQHIKDHAAKKARLVDLANQAALKIAQCIESREAQIARYRAEVDDYSARINHVLALIDGESNVIAADHQCLSEQEAIVSTAQAVADDALAQVPDMDAVRARLKDVEEANRKFEANAASNAAQRQADLTRETLNAIVDNLDAARDAREARIKAAKFPVEGLAFGDNGVLYKNVPFEQASTAVKLRVSVAVGLALNPSLKVLLIREGAFLDADNLALVGQLAQDADAQVWIERVGTDGVSVVIEDGHVAGI